MKVIKRGNEPIREAECTCNKCQSVLLVNVSDLYVPAGGYDPFFACPVCSKRHPAPRELRAAFDAPKPRNMLDSTLGMMQTKMHDWTASSY